VLNKLKETKAMKMTPVEKIRMRIWMKKKLKMKMRIKVEMKTKSMRKQTSNEF